VRDFLIPEWKIEKSTGRTKLPVGFYYGDLGVISAERRAKNLIFLPNPTLGKI